MANQSVSQIVGFKNHKSSVLKPINFKIVKHYSFHQKHNVLKFSVKILFRKTSANTSTSMFRKSSICKLDAYGPCVPRNHESDRW